MVGSGPAQQAMLSEGSDPANPPKQTFELNLFLKKLRVQFTDIWHLQSGELGALQAACQDRECRWYSSAGSALSYYECLWYSSAGSALSYYVVRLHWWYNSYPVVTEATGPSLRADNLNHVAVDS